MQHLNELLAIYQLIKDYTKQLTIKILLSANGYPGVSQL